MNWTEYDPKDFEGKGGTMWRWIVVLSIFLAIGMLA